MTELDEKNIKTLKLLRKQLDENLQLLKNLYYTSERSIAIVKIKEAIMWLGVSLGELSDTNPYPESKNPDNTIIHKHADDLII